MTNHDDQPPTPVALVTGGSQRIGAAIVRALHGRGMDVALHYRRSREAASRLAAELNAARADSAALFQADIRDIRQVNHLLEAVVQWQGRLDLLVNNASTFYPTPMGRATEEQWDELLDTNLKAPFFLAQAAAPPLRASQGSIVNLADIHGQQPLKGHPVYSCAKAGNVMLTRSLARELGPEVRVNGIAPGAIMWPASGMDDVARQRIINRTALKRQGDATDIAATVVFLALEAPYITGQIIAVDGGRSLGY